MDIKSPQDKAGKPAGTTIQVTWGLGKFFIETLKRVKADKNDYSAFQPLSSLTIKIKSREVPQELSEPRA